MATKYADNTKSFKLPIEIKSYNDLGQTIKKYRKEKGITQKQFASLIHVAESTIRSWEQKKFLPTYHTYKKIKELISNTL